MPRAQHFEQWKEEIVTIDLNLYINCVVAFVVDFRYADSFFVDFKKLELRTFQ